MNEHCCICNMLSRNMCSIYENKGSITYAEMITSLANIQVNLEGKFFICRICSTKLKNAYELKNTIQSSQILLQSANKNKIAFDDFNDISEYIKKFDVKLNNCLENIQYEYKFYIEGTASHYGDTIIKPIKSDINNCTVVGGHIEEVDFDDCNFDNGNFNNDDFEDSVIEDMPLSSRKHEFELLHKETQENQSNKSSRTERYKEREKKNNQLSIEEFLELQELNVGPRIRRKYKPRNNKTIKLTTPLVPVQMKDLKVIPEYRKRNPNKPKAELKKYICPHCGVLKKNIKSHLRSHSGQSYTCDVCFKILTSLDGLLKHKVRHSGIRNFKCKHCIATFYHKGDLQLHLKSHSDEKPYVCSICNASFKWSGGYRRHLKRHDQVQHLSCDFCPKQFNDKAALGAHIKSHTGVKPFNCQLCNQPYAHKREFNKHCLKNHGVFLNKRPIHVLNQDVISKERVLMKEIKLRVDGGIKDCADAEWNPFPTDRTGKVFRLAVQAIKSGQVTVHL